MSKNIPQFDFSKQEDQEKFNKLSQEQRGMHIENAQEEAVLEEFKSLLHEDTEKAREFIDDYNISPEKIQEVVVNEIARSFRYGLFSKNRVKRIIKIFSPPKEKLQDMMFELILSNFKTLTSARYIEKKLEIIPLSEEKLNSSEIQDVVFEAIVVLLERGQNNIHTAQQYQQIISLPEEKLQEAVSKGVASNLESAQIVDVETILKIFPLPGAKLQEIVFETVVKKFSMYSIDVVKEIKEILKTFPLPEEKLNSLKIQNAINIHYPQGITIKELFNLYNIVQIGEKICQSIYDLNNFSYSNQIKPLLNGQGDSAYLYFELIKSDFNFKNLSTEDKDYIVYVGKKYGTQARNILQNILARVDSIADEREVIEEYINEIGIIQFEIYSQYKTAKESGDEFKVKKIKERINDLSEKIYQGKMKKKDFDDDLYEAILYYIFPPAIGLTQEQYSQLNKNRSDRRDDVPETLDDLQYEKVSISTGRYILSEGEELNLEEWSALSEIIKKVNKEMESGREIEIDTEKIGAEIIEIYRNKKQHTGEGRNFLLEQMYRYHLASGRGKLESNYEISVNGLMQYKEFVGDRVKNDLIRTCLMAWKEKHVKEYEKLKKEIINRLKQSQNKNFAKVKNMLKAIKKQKDKNKKSIAIKRLNDFLLDFGLTYESIKNLNQKKLQTELGTIKVEYNGDSTEENYRTEEYYNSEEFLSVYDEFMNRYDEDMLVMQKISSDLVANVNKKMRKEIDKFKFRSENGEIENYEIEFVVSKKKEHGVVGYNMGVCVTPDEKLWNDSQFMNCILFSPESKQAMGGMHFLIRENNLCLPGINPSQDILSYVDNEELFDKMMEYAKKVKEKLGLKKVLIPTNSSIYSNRSQIHSIVTKKNYKKVNLEKTANFSYNPYVYSFQECLEVE